MEKYQNLHRARHHIVFLAALVFGSVLIYFLNTIDLRKQGTGVIVMQDTIAPEINITTRELLPQELDAAKTAWRYFENNYQEQTGLVNSVQDYPSTTLWDTGNYLMGLIAAHQLKVIDSVTYEKRMAKALQTISTLTLYKGMLPNKVYNTITLKMTDYTNNESKDGVGWSAIDIGRILIPLAYLNFYDPKFAKDAKAVVSKWNLKMMTKEGVLYGMTPDEKGVIGLRQEGRLGYEQYTAKMFATFGIDITNAIRYDKFLAFTDIYGIAVPYDTRNLKRTNANNYVLMEPYMLDGIEFGWDYFSREFCYRLYEVQRRRYQETNILTAMTEDHIDQAPYFIYNTIYVNDKKWQAIDDTGKPHNEFKQLSTKAIFAMDALYQSDYTQKLIDAIKPLQTEKGWYTGIYEQGNKPNKSITCNTNAIVLESLWYKKNGPLLKMITDK